jgi:hypothetical protein
MGKYVNFLSLLRDNCFPLIFITFWLTLSFEAIFIHTTLHLNMITILKLFTYLFSNWFTYSALNMFSVSLFQLFITLFVKKYSLWLQFVVGCLKKPRDRWFSPVHLIEAILELKRLDHVASRPFLSWCY